MSSPDIMIVFWGNPLYDGRCVNMINQFRDEKLTVKIIGVGKDNKTFDFNGAEIKLIYDSREIYTQLAGLVNRPIIQKIWSWYEKKYIYSADYVIANAEIDQEYLKIYRVAAF